MTSQAESMAPRNIAPKDFELWTGRIALDPALTAVDVQQIVDEYVAEHRTAIVGYHTQEPPALTLLRWPDNREGYQAPEVEECNKHATELAHRLGASTVTINIVPEGKIHTMMGRKMGGYGEGVEAPMKDFRMDLPGYSVTKGYMVSARAVDKPDGTWDVESYGEPIAAIVANASDENVIHKIGNDKRQYHYAIEIAPVGDDTPGRTEFYETHWARADQIK